MGDPGWGSLRNMFGWLRCFAAMAVESRRSPKATRPPLPVEVSCRLTVQRIRANGVELQLEIDGAVLGGDCWITRMECGGSLWLREVSQEEDQPAIEPLWEDYRSGVAA